MSAINHQELRELATDLQRMATHQKLLAFRAMLSPSAVLALLDELEHARTMAPAIRLTLHHEIKDFCATLESPGESETPVCAPVTTSPIPLSNIAMMKPGCASTSTMTRITPA
ncbi:hypothetical protein [Escherichia coli]|uniref:hypothetical protein n=1 Tax=Escherichia coli TaxID=562 RepID=UPI001FCE737C|nr:hypothetical protein [Escherichia coli]